MLPSPKMLIQKRILNLILAGLLIAIPARAADAPDYLPVQTFESAALDTTPGEWSVHVADGSSGSAVVSALAHGKDSKSLKLANSDSTSAEVIALIKLKKRINVHEPGAYLFQADIYPDQIDASLLIALFDQAGHQTASVNFNNLGSITANDIPVKGQNGHYAENAWYTVQIRFSPSKRTYSVNVNGDAWSGKASDVKFMQEPTADIAYIEFMNYGNKRGTASFNIDNVSVSAVPDPSGDDANPK